ncbi:MAG TPA: energy transducer TonB [Bacteroidales bacterium]|nr:energy transducer TonB [Bacteroidales bacterium]HSA43703.1 energy transducer TonB [Bacteroidales bacterium]
MKTTAFIRENLDEIVFTGRNTAYGAYEIRKKYAKTLNEGTAIAVLILLVGTSIPLIANYYRNQSHYSPSTEISVEITTMPSPPPPPLPPIPPDMAQTERMTRFLKPIITLDTSETSELLTQSELNTMNFNQHIDTTPPDFTIKEPDRVIQEAPRTEPFTVVQEMPEFPGGNEAMHLFLKKHLVYPPLARSNDIFGTVYVAFTVDETGEVIDPEVKKGVGYGCDEEAMRVISMMKWKPGRQAGKAVPVRFTIPIRFVLQG